jgi:hypothetical protein
MVIRPIFRRPGRVEDFSAVGLAIDPAIATDRRKMWQ